MKRLFLLVVFFTCSIQFLYPQDFSAVASNEPKENSLESSLLLYNEYSDMLPQPVGGLKNVIEKINYPAPAKSFRVEGTVILLAYINEYGEVKSVEIIKNIGFGCGEAAAKVIAEAKFIPAVKNGKNASVKAAIPVKFQLYR